MLGWKVIDARKNGALPGSFSEMSAVFFRSYNQTKFFENYVIVVIIPTGACQPVALWLCVKQRLWRVLSAYGVKSGDNIGWDCPAVA